MSFLSKIKLKASLQQPLSLKGVPPFRKTLYFILLSLLPIVFVFFLNHKSKQNILAVDKAIEELQATLLLQRSKKVLNLAVYKTHQNSDPHFIDKELEKYTLLKDEILTLEEKASKTPYLMTLKAKERLNFLKNKNTLRFTEKVIFNNKHFRETTEVLNHPVEVSGKDIYTLLEKIEGKTTPKKPLIFITDFSLKKTKHNTFTLQLKLMKREFL